MQAPRLEKITLNMGIGEAKVNTSLLDAAAEQLAVIAGQKPAVRRARKSIANFKLRQGMPVGIKVTLRRRAHVGDARPAAVGRDPTDPGLPGAQPAVVRRSRQLLDGSPGADHLPRDRLRRDRSGAGPRRHDHDHAPRPTRRRSSCCACSACLSAATSVPGRPPPRCGRRSSRPRRSEPPRSRPPRARGRAAAEEPRPRRGREAGEPSSNGGEPGRGIIRRESDRPTARAAENE